jgi:hypothetical protein
MSFISALAFTGVSSLTGGGVIMLYRSPIRELLVLPAWPWHGWTGSLSVLLAGGLGIVVTSVAFVARRTCGDRADTRLPSDRRRYRLGKARMR